MMMMMMGRRTGVLGPAKAQNVDDEWLLRGSARLEVYGGTVFSQCWRWDGMGWDGPQMAVGII